MSLPQKISLRKALIDGFWSGLLALVIFGPISGLILQGYEVRNELLRPLLMALLVGGGRFLMSCSMQSPKGKIYFEKLFGKRGAGVTVASQEKHTYQFLLIPFLILAGLCLPFLLGKYC